jgi:hypothetical protein
MGIPSTNKKKTKIPSIPKTVPKPKKSGIPSTSKKTGIPSTKKEQSFSQDNIDPSKIQTIEEFQRIYQVNSDLLADFFHLYSEKYNVKMDIHTLRKAFLEQIKSMSHIEVVKTIDEFKEQFGANIKKMKSTTKEVLETNPETDNVEPTIEQKKIESMDDELELDEADLIETDIRKVSEKSKVNRVNEIDVSEMKEIVEKFDLEENLMKQLHYLRLSIDANSTDESFRNWKLSKWHEALVISQQSKINNELMRERLEFDKKRYELDLKMLESNNVAGNDELELLRSVVEEQKNKINDLQAEKGIMESQIMLLKSDVKAKPKKKTTKKKKKTTKKTTKKRTYN